MKRRTKGTLFLDEIGDMSPTMQVKLFGVACKKARMTPVGGNRAAQGGRASRRGDEQRPSRDMVEHGTFREDLYYRINVINLVVPSLRDRKEDIPLCSMEHFVNRGCKEKGDPHQAKVRQTHDGEDVRLPVARQRPRARERSLKRLKVLTGDEPRIAAELATRERRP